MKVALRPPWGLCKACLHQAQNLVSLNQFHHTPIGMYDGDGIAAITQGFELGGDKHLRPVMVALILYDRSHVQQIMVYLMIIALRIVLLIRL